jgi:hypothetical protein
MDKQTIEDNIDSMNRSMIYINNYVSSMYQKVNKISTLWDEIEYETAQLSSYLSEEITYRNRIAQECKLASEYIDNDTISDCDNSNCK